MKQKAIKIMDRSRIDNMNVPGPVQWSLFLNAKIKLNFGEYEGGSPGLWNHKDTTRTVFYGFKSSSVKCGPLRLVHTTLQICCNLQKTVALQIIRKISIYSQHNLALCDSLCNLQLVRTRINGTKVYKPIHLLNCFWTIV